MPKAGDVVKVRYRAWTMKKKKDGTLKKDGNFIDTDHLGPGVAFKIMDDDDAHVGMYRGLNKVVRTMNLGEEADIILSPALAFGDKGLSRYYEPNAGFAKTQMEVLGTAMPNDPNAPEDHRDRNPLCIAYLGVPPGASVFLEGLALMEVDGKRRALPQRGCLDCLWSSIANGLGFNSGTY